MTSPTPLADTHCHLCLPAFDDDLVEVVERARQAGVQRILVPGIDLETSQRAVALARTFPEIRAAVGVHPHHSGDYSGATRRELRRLASAPGVVAIGEIGLDYYRDLSPRPSQQQAFEDQLELADQVGLPVVVHQRQAADDVLARLIPWASQRPRPGVLHAFGGEHEVARQAEAAGLYLGLAGPLTYPGSEPLRAAASGLRRDRVLLETDAPYLTPHPMRRQRNEPAHLTLVAEALDRLWNGETDSARRTAWHNADALFRWNHGTDDRNLL